MNLVKQLINFLMANFLSYDKQGIQSQVAVNFVLIV